MPNRPGTRGSLARPRTTYSRGHTHGKRTRSNAWGQIDVTVAFGIGARLPGRADWQVIRVYGSSVAVRNANVCLDRANRTRACVSGVAPVRRVVPLMPEVCDRRARPSTSMAAITTRTITTSRSCPSNFLLRLMTWHRYNLDGGRFPVVPCGSPSDHVAKSARKPAP